MPEFDTKAVGYLPDYHLTRILALVRAGEGLARIIREQPINLQDHEADDALQKWEKATS